MSYGYTVCVVFYSVFRLFAHTRTDVRGRATPPRRRTTPRDADATTPRDARDRDAVDDASTTRRRRVDDARPRSTARSTSIDRSTPPDRRRRANARDRSTPTRERARPIDARRERARRATVVENDAGVDARATAVDADDGGDDGDDDDGRVDATATRDGDDGDDGG